MPRQRAASPVTASKSPFEQAAAEPGRVEIDMVAPFPVRRRQYELHAGNLDGRRQPFPLQRLPLKLPGIDVTGERDGLETRFFRRQFAETQRSQPHVVEKAQTEMARGVERRIPAIAQQSIVEINLDNVLAQDVTQGEPTLLQRRLSAGFVLDAAASQFGPGKPITRQVPRVVDAGRRLFLARHWPNAPVKFLCIARPGMDRQACRQRAVRIGSVKLLGAGVDADLGANVLRRRQLQHGANFGVARERGGRGQVQAVRPDDDRKPAVDLDDPVVRVINFDRSGGCARERLAHRESQ